MATNSDSWSNIRPCGDDGPPSPTRPASTRVVLKDLEIPPALAEAIEEACKQFGFRSLRDRLYIEEELKLQYYYGGQDVACIQTPHGRAVVAAGSAGSGELREALQHLGPAERRSVSTLFPEPWDDQTLSVPSVFFDEA
jgi:hypothetical protein